MVVNELRMVVYIYSVPFFTPQSLCKDTKGVM